MFKMKKVEKLDNAATKGQDLLNEVRHSSSKITKSPLNQLGQSAKDVNVPPVSAPLSAHLSKVAKAVSDAASSTSDKMDSQKDKTKEAISKFMEGVSATGKKIDSQLNEKGINMKKDGVSLALNTLGLAGKYLAQTNKKKVLKTAIKFVALMPVRPVLIATGVGVGVYVVAKKVKAHKADKAEKMRLENLKTANKGVSDTDKPTDNQNNESSVIVEDFLKKDKK